MRSTQIRLAIVAALIYLTASKVTSKGRYRPRNVTVEPIDATTLLARWEHPRTVRTCSVSRYIVRMKYEGQDESSADKVLGNETQVYLRDMHPDSGYLVRVVAVGCRGKSPPTKWVRARTPPSRAGQQRASRSGDFVLAAESMVPGKPTHVRTRTLTDSIILSWEPPRDKVLVRGYMVGYGEAVPDVNWQYVDAETRTFTIRNLKPSSQYVISLRAFNNFGKGLVVYDLVYTREDMGPTVGPLSSPIGLRSRILSPKTAWLEWTDPSLGGAQKITDDRYYIVSVNEMPIGDTKTLTVKALNVVVYELKPAMTYEFRVKTRKADEETAYGISVYNTTFDAAPESPPRSLTVIPVNSTLTSVSVSWLAPEKPNGVLNGYLIFYAEENPEGDPEEWTIEGVLGDIYHVTIHGFDPDVSYVFKIQARNAKGYSPMSDPVIYRRRVEGPEKPPRGFEVMPSNVSMTEVWVSWLPPENSNGTITQYAISYQEAGEDGELGEVWHIKRARGDVNKLTIEGFRPDVAYNFRIQARKADRYGPFSPVITYRRFDLKDIEMYDEEDPEDSDSNDTEGKGDIQNDTIVLDPQFYRAPMEADTRVKQEQSAENDNSAREWPAPASIRTVVRHRVSAVLAWDDDAEGENETQNVRYDISYVRQGYGHRVLTQNSHIPVFLLENLHVATRYMYNISMRNEDSNEILWLKQGVLDTAYDP